MSDHALYVITYPCGHPIGGACGFEPSEGPLYQMLGGGVTLDMQKAQVLGPKAAKRWERDFQHWDDDQSDPKLTRVRLLEGRCP